MTLNLIISISQLIVASEARISTEICYLTNRGHLMSAPLKQTYFETWTASLETRAPLSLLLALQDMAPPSKLRLRMKLGCLVSGQKCRSHAANSWGGRVRLTPRYIHLEQRSEVQSVRVLSISLYFSGGNQTRKDCRCALQAFKPHSCG